VRRTRQLNTAWGTFLAPAFILGVWIYKKWSAMRRA